MSVAVKSPELRNCPFCDGRPAMNRITQEFEADNEGTAGAHDAHFEVRCDVCGVGVGDEHRDEAVRAWNRRGGRDKPEVKNFSEVMPYLTELLPMEAELWAYGADLETARFQARMLRQNGYYLVRSEDIGWDEIHAYQDELRKGQDIYEDAGGFFSRALMAMFGKRPDPVTNYQNAVQALLEAAELRRDGGAP